MTKSRDARGQTDADTRSSPPVRPLKPQRGLFVMFALALVASFAAILWMYFTTVHHG